MPDTSVVPCAYIEVSIAERPRRVVPISELPFSVGRGHESGNHLVLDDLRISRKCLTISEGMDGLRVEDRGQRGGIFVNGTQVNGGQVLHDGDHIRVGTDDACQIVFRLSASAADGNEGPHQRNLLDSHSGDSRIELDRLTRLLEASSLLHSQLPLDAIFETMLDHGVAITRADRGILLEPDATGTLQIRVARGNDRSNLPLPAVNPSRTVLGQAVEQRTTVINEDLRLADLNVQTAQSVVLQYLRSAVVIPLYSSSHGSNADSQATDHAHLLGAVYLDSKRESAFSALDRKILDAIGGQAASILDNARLMQRERERQRLEQELSIARQIQQALVPHGLQDYPHLAITGMHRPCHEVGGDYFDVFPMDDDRIAILIADVAGKGLGAALLTTMLQGALSAMPLGVDPLKLFEHLNRFLCYRAEVGRYVTMFFGVLDRAGNLEFVRAGHPSPLLLRRGEVSELYTGGTFPVGLVEEATFESSRTRLEPDDTLLLFTDGVTEAEDKNRDLFGFGRLQEVFAQQANRSLDQLQSAIFGAVEKFATDAKQSDDITLLAIRYRKPSGAAKH